jgi:hypothetical protein
VLASVLIGLSAPLVQAETRTFRCVVEQRSNSFYQPGTMKVTIDYRLWKVRVEDELTRKVSNGPAIGQLETWSDRRQTVIWTVKDLPNDGKSVTSYGKATLFQRLTIRPDGTGALTTNVSWNLPRRKPQFRSEVTCTAQK